MDLHVRKLSLSTPTKTVVDDISFHVAQNQTLAVIGPSGSGKTTLLRGILGIAANLTISGQVKLSAARREEASSHERCFGYIPQESSLWPHLSVFDTIKLAGHFSRRFRTRDEMHARAAQLMSDCGLASLEKRKPQSLSGGEKKRLAIARALIGAPRVLMLDEPFSGLDVVAKSELISLIVNLKNDVGFSMIFVSHDLAETLLLGDQIMIMDRGRSHWIGPKHELSSARFLSHWNPLNAPLVCFHQLNNAT